MAIQLVRLQYDPEYKKAGQRKDLGIRTMMPECRTESKSYGTVFSFPMKEVFI